MRLSNLEFTRVASACATILSATPILPGRLVRLALRFLPHITSSTKLCV